MKRKILLITALACGLYAQAQYINENTSAPVKLSDVVERYMQSDQHLLGSNEEEENGRVKEDKDYHFNRWLWYWRQHTDANGYIVSPIKTYQEWLKYNAAQQKTTAGNASNWQFQGPTSSPGGYYGIGRINNIAFHPTDPNTYWVCTAGGGLWKTTNNGVSWTILTNNLPVLGTSDLKVNPLNPNTMYLCTGDRDASNTYSIGVMKSTDGGQTWNATGLNWTPNQYRLANSIVINKTDTNSLTLASNNGIYKSYNGGNTWTQVQTGNFRQVLYHPTDTSILYATVYNSSVTADIYRSKNGGASWTKVTTFSNKRRITLAVTPANVAIVKAIVATNGGGLDGIYNSTDTGKTFTKIYGPTGCNGDLLAGNNAPPYNSCGNQGWYDLAFAIDPNNANKVFAGGVNTWTSVNGGTTWHRCTQWYAQAPGVAEVHADKHWQAFHPLVANRLFECNDGGIYRTDNPDSNSVWNDITNGMGTTQFYRNAVASNAGFVLGGAQDNGTKMLQSGSWSNADGGDGMDCQIDYANPATYYTSYQNGAINRHSTVWGDAPISDSIPGKPTGPWITPYIVSPRNHDHLVAGYKHIYFSANAGNKWMSITGAALDPANRFIYRVAMTPANDSTIYTVIENSKKIMYTYSFVPGNTTTFDSLICPLTGGNISDIKIDPKDHKHFWVTIDGYGSSQVAEYKNNTWTAINTGLPNVPVHCLELDSANNIMYVGTDIGVFYLDTINKQWSAFNTNLPSIEVTDLGIDYAAKELWASTYGRGMWACVKQQYATADTTDTGTVVTIIPYAPDNISISPNPSQGRFTVKATSERLFGKQADILILDNAGRVVWKSKQVFDGSGLLQINAETLSKAVYILSIGDGQTTIGRKRIIIN